MNKSSLIYSQKNTKTSFLFESYIEADNQCSYIQELITSNLKKKKIQIPVFSMTDLQELLKQINVPLKNRQIHELYLYATYNEIGKKQQPKQRLQAVVNNEKKKIDIQATAQWVNNNIKKGNIKFVKTRAVSSIQGKVQGKPSSEGKQWRLPPIRGTSSEKLTEQLKYLVEIFEEMERQRQNSGLIPINLESDGQELDLSSAHIPYDPELYQLNKSLARLKMKAEDRLARIIQLAKDQPRIRMKLEDAIQKFQRVRIEANEKIGRIGSMKAQKRLIQNRKKQENKLKNLRLGEQEDLLRAAKLYSLLSIQQRNSNKLIL